MIKPIIAANWKMHKTIPEAVAFAKQLKKEFPEPGRAEIVIAPPFTALLCHGSPERFPRPNIGSEYALGRKGRIHRGDFRRHAC